MPLEQIKKLVEENKANEDFLKQFKDYIKGYIDHTVLGGDVVEKFLETESGKKLLQPKLDQYFTKGLSTWKEKSLPKLIEEEITKRYPEESAESKALRELRAEFEKERQARIRTELKNKAVELATSKKMPVSFVDFLVGQDEDTTVNNFEKFESIFKAAIEEAVKAKFKESGRDVDSKEGDPPPGSDTSKMTTEEFIKFRTKQDQNK